MIVTQEEINLELAEVYRSAKGELSDKMEYAVASTISNTSNDDTQCFICLDSSDICLKKCRHKYCIKCTCRLFDIRLKKLLNLNLTETELPLIDLSFKVLKCFFVECCSSFEKDLLKDILPKKDFKALIEIIKKFNLIMNNQKLGFSGSMHQNIPNHKNLLISPIIKEKCISENPNNNMLESQISILGKQSKRVDLSQLNKQILNLNSSVNFKNSMIVIRKKGISHKIEHFNCQVLECNNCFPTSQDWITDKSCMLCFSKCIHSLEKESPIKCLSCLDYTCMHCHYVIIARNKSQLICLNNKHTLKDSLTNYTHTSKNELSKSTKKSSLKRQFSELMFDTPVIFVILRVIFIVLIINDRLNKCFCMKSENCFKMCVKFGLLISIVVFCLVYLILISIVI